MIAFLAQSSAAGASSSPLPIHGFSYDALLSTFYGVVEGLTEFLPVSSTAHLRIAEKLTGVDMASGYWKMYSIIIQLGAILSVPLLFWDRIMKFVRTFPHGDPPQAGGSTPTGAASGGEAAGALDYATPEARPRTWYNHPLSLVAIAFLVTAGPCYLADKYIAKNLENLTVMAWALVVGGIIMWVVDFFFSPPRATPRTTRMEQMGLLDAVWVGVVQILSAVFPGTSRSMCTIAAGQIFGMSRSAALEFSFFLAMPTMLAATGYKMMQMLFHHKSAEEAAAYHAPPHQWIILAIGFVVSFIVAWAVNRWFIHWVRTRGFAPFAVYRILLGVLLLTWLFTHA